MGDLGQLSDGFRHSIDWLPVQVNFAPSLVQSNEHGQAGDYNGDGVVDHLDYEVWSANFGLPNGAADGNGDGIVDTADYAVWRDNVGSVAGLAGIGHPASNAISIPEPPVAALAMIALCLAVPAYRVPQIRGQRISDRGRVGNNLNDWLICEITRRDAEELLEEVSAAALRASDKRSVEG